MKMCFHWKNNTFLSFNWEESSSCSAVKEEDNNKIIIIRKRVKKKCLHHWHPEEGMISFLAQVVLKVVNICSLLLSFQDQSKVEQENEDLLKKIMKMKNKNVLYIQHSQGIVY